MALFLVVGMHNVHSSSVRSGFTRHLLAGSAINILLVIGESLKHKVWRRECLQ